MMTIFQDHIRYVIIILTALLIGCDKNEDIELKNGLHFSTLIYKKDNSIFKIDKTIVEYENIIAYDSATHIFQINEKEWQIINDSIPLDNSPYNIFGFGIVLNEKLIYRVAYLGNYHSYTTDDLTKFELAELNYIIIDCNSEFEEKLANDYRIINLLSKDNKLKSIDLEIEKN